MNLIIRIIFSYLTTGIITIALAVIGANIYALYYRNLRNEPYKLLKFGYKCQTYGNRNGEVNKASVKDWIILILLWPICVICSLMIIEEILNDL